MTIVLNDLLYALGSALDCVESQLIGVTTNHSRRVAYLCILLARDMGLSQQEQLYVAAAAVLHDNALTEYVHEEFEQKRKTDASHSAFLGVHCTIGEENAARLPFYDRIRGAIAYHHERPDGLGPFCRRTENTPLFARLIQFADQLDAKFGLGTMTKEKRADVRAFVRAQSGTMFDHDCAVSFLAISDAETMQALAAAGTDGALEALLPQEEILCSGRELKELAALFARITDYKSAFTCRHSLGIAEKAEQMAAYYGWDKETAEKLYFAGALHDIGKLTVASDILEKPDRLTDEEYHSIQNHAMGTYRVLSAVRGLEDVTMWASRHHEKLDGSGYPFGLTADDLDEKERLLACLDIYQALTEPRPYKDGMSHEAAMNILRQMVARGQLDGRITEDIALRFAP